MARLYNGSINYPLNFNVGKTAPLDSRAIIEHESDLINSETWPTNAPAYKGMTVTVADTGEIWILKNKEYFQDKTSGKGWVKSGNSIVPKERNKLIYSYDDASLTSNYLIPENSKLYVVDNAEDFEACKGKGIIEPDIINEFLQYSDTVYMPEYGKGRSYVKGNHKPQVPQQTSYFEGIGYSYWYEDEGDAQGENKFILNPVNSYEYNGYINPQKASYFNYDVLIGTDKGDTTGDWSGYALVNDDNAVPRNIVCSDGNTYYRNTLYDLTLSDGYAEDPYDSDESVDDDLEYWCAWVNEKKDDNTAYVIYGKQIKVDGTDYWEDEFPSETVSVYKILDISNKAGRKEYSRTIFDTVTVESANESSGFIAVLNILTNNSSGCRWEGLVGDNTLVNATGTIFIFTNIILCNNPENYNPFNNIDPLFESKLHVPERSVLVGSSDIINIPDVYGINLVPYDSNLNSYNWRYERGNSIDPAYIIDDWVDILPEPSVELENHIILQGNNFTLKQCIYDDSNNEYKWVTIPLPSAEYFHLIQLKTFGNSLGLYNPLYFERTKNKWWAYARESSLQNGTFVDYADNSIYYWYDFTEHIFKAGRVDELHTFNEFIRSNVTYNNGKLTLHFSDVIGGPNQNNVFDKTFLNKSTIATNFPLNGSEVVIDFNNDYYLLIYKGGQTGTNQMLLSTLDNYVHTYEIDGKQVTINFNDLFKNNAKFMFTAYSQQNLLYKCTYYTYKDIFILRTDNNTVWKYNYLTTDYDQVINSKPSEYFPGSHLLFNEVTGKLWYSNGINIYEVNGSTKLQELIATLEERIARLEPELD